MRLVISLLALLVSVTLASGQAAHPPADQAERGDPPATRPPPTRQLDPAFAKWAKDAGEPTFRAVSERFLRAAQRDPELYRVAMDQLEARFRTALRDHKTTSDPKERCRALATFLFESEGLAASPDLASLDNLFPDGILARRSGYCVGLALIVLELGERLGWPLVPMSAPRHVYVRYVTEGESINFETTRSGSSPDDGWYREHFSLAGRRPPLSSREFVAHLINNHGYALLQQGWVADAAREFELALSLEPRLAEALINVGVAHGTKGDFRSARVAFERAKGLWPDDGRLEINRLEAWLATGEDLRTCALAALKFSSQRPTAPIAEYLLRLRSQLSPVNDWDLLQLISGQVAERRLAGARVRGLTGRYFGGRKFEKELRARVDPEISFNWGWQSPGRGLPRDNFSIRWEGFLEVESADEYTFLFFCSDGVRLWIDGRSVVDAWHQSVDNVAQGAIRLAPGLHEIRVDYFEVNGDAGILMMLAAENRDDMLEVSKIVFTADPTEKTK